jgi:CBS-domain-containing membrane protein
MRTWQVGDVMTRDVAAVTPATGYREVVDLLTSRHVTAVPVVDSVNRVVGVVSQADLLYKVELLGEPHERRIFESRRRRRSKVKADARTAGELMSSPAASTYPTMTVAQAAKVMDRERVKSLPVLNDLGRLVGIVSRGDLLKVHLRPDADIRDDVVQEIFHRVLGVPDGQVRIEVTNGVVRLAGELDRRSSVETAVRFTANVSGVVSVDNELTFAVDDTSVATIVGVA